jgi:hypothetical protein
MEAMGMGKISMRKKKIKEFLRSQAQVLKKGKEGLKEKKGNERLQGI